MKITRILAGNDIQVTGYTRQYLPFALVLNEKTDLNHYSTYKEIEQYVNNFGLYLNDVENKKKPTRPASVKAFVVTFNIINENGLHSGQTFCASDGDESTLSTSHFSMRKSNNTPISNQLNQLANPRDPFVIDYGSILTLNLDEKALDLPPILNDRKRLAERLPFEALEYRCTAIKKQLEQQRQINSKQAFHALRIVTLDDSIDPNRFALNQDILLPEKPLLMKKDHQYFLRSSNNYSGSTTTEVSAQIFGPIYNELCKGKTIIFNQLMETEITPTNIHLYQQLIQFGLELKKNEEAIDKDHEYLVAMWFFNFIERVINEKRSIYLYNKDPAIKAAILNDLQHIEQLAFDTAQPIENKTSYFQQLVQQHAKTYNKSMTGVIFASMVSIAIPTLVSLLAMGAFMSVTRGFEFGMIYLAICCVLLITIPIVVNSISYINNKSKEMTVEKKNIHDFSTLLCKKGLFTPSLPNLNDQAISHPPSSDLIKNNNH